MNDQELLLDDFDFDFDLDGDFDLDADDLIGDALDDARIVNDWD